MDGSDRESRAGEGREPVRRERELAAVAGRLVPFSCHCPCSAQKRTGSRGSGSEDEEGKGFPVLGACVDGRPPLDAEGYPA